LTSALDGGEWSATRPGRVIPRERNPGEQWIGGRVEPRVGLDALVKRKVPSLGWDSNPRLSNPQPSTDDDDIIAITKTIIKFSVIAESLAREGVKSIL
jgi:hypothetical protein